MERYYKILGIPNNSSKEVVKKAYYTKMKALHPDKIHGTALEDTATFFTTEINEAYNQLMSQNTENNTSSNQSKQSAYIEETIYIETNGYLKYTLSNDLNVIIEAIYNRVKCTLHQSQIQWDINSGLSQNVKKSMNTYNVNYSMTTFWEGSVEYVVINKRANNSWYIALFDIITQPKNSYSNTTNNYSNNNNNKNVSKQYNPLAVLIKILISILVFSILFIIFENNQSSYSKPQVNNTRYAQVFANVIYCEWLNVRNTPSSADKNNLIDAIRVNTKVEILERANDNWVKIRYGNNKTGYVHSNYLSF